MSIVSNYDSKDATIHRLKLEIEELKKNEKDYSDLSFILTNLEHRYNLLNEEKVRNEADFSHRSNLQIQQIADLKTQLSNFQNKLTTTERHLEDLKLHTAAQNDLAKHQEIDNDKLKLELSSTSNAYLALKNENLALEQKLRELSNENGFLREDNEKLGGMVEELGVRMESLERNEGVYEESLEELKKDNSFLRSEIEEKSSNLKLLDEQLQLADQKINQMASEASNGKKEHDNICSQVKDLSNQLELEQEKTNHLLSEYNLLVDSYNSLSAKNQDLFHEISQLNLQINDQSIDFTAKTKLISEDLCEIQDQAEEIRQKRAKFDKIKDLGLRKEEEVKILMNELRDVLNEGKRRGKADKIKKPFKV